MGGKNRIISALFYGYQLSYYELFKHIVKMKEFFQCISVYSPLFLPLTFYPVVYTAVHPSTPSILPFIFDTFQSKLLSPKSCIMNVID